MCAESFFDVCSRYDGVFLCSHSNLAAVCPHERNLADWQVTELFRRGGVLGLNLYPPFLRSGPPARPTSSRTLSTRFRSAGRVRFALAVILTAWICCPKT